MSACCDCIISLEVLFLQEKIFFEEVGECPAYENLAVYEMGCCDCDNVVYLACPRDIDLNCFFDWLLGMVCNDCNSCSEA